MLTIDDLCDLHEVMDLEESAAAKSDNKRTMEAAKKGMVR